MPKYQLLEASVEHEPIPDDDESVTFLDNNNVIEPNNVNNNNKYNKKIVNFKQSKNNGVVCINPAHDTDIDDNTMEVPLLYSNNSEYEGDASVRTQEQIHEHGLCKQRGFAADIHCKATQEAKFKMLCAIALCCVFMVIEFIGGYLAGSLAIMTDAAHLASDCITFVIGLVAIWLGARRPDGKMSFGYKRMEVFGAIISILSIWILTVMLVLVAFKRLYTLNFDLDADTMMIISGIGILINIVMIYILHGPSLQLDGAHGHSHMGHSHGHNHSHSHSHSHRHEHLTVYEPAPNPPNGSTAVTLDSTMDHLLKDDLRPERHLNLRAAIIHVIGDLVQSFGVFLASVLIKFEPSAKFADPLCTLLFSVIVVSTTIRLFRESISILMDAVPDHIGVDELESDLLHIDGVKNVHHLNVWNHTSSYSILMVHLVIDFVTDSNLVLEQAIKLATSAKYNIKHCTIQIERLTS